MKTVISLGVLALIAIGVGYYFLVIAPSSGPAEGSPCSSKGDGVNDGKIVNGACVKNTASNNNLPNVIPTSALVSPTLSFGSSEVNGASVSTSQSPVLFFANVSESDIGPHNIFTSAGTNPSLIHFKTGFNNQCQKYVWYKNWMYVFRGAEVDSTTGVKTCYYKVDKSQLPSELKVITLNGKCANYKLFISGIEYKYSETKIEKQNSLSSSLVTYCIYKQQ